MLDYDFRSDVGYWVHMTAHRFERAMNAELAAEGMTYRQGQVLAWLSLDGELAQVELAERMNVEPPTIVRVLDCMERDGLIERIGCPGDRRRKVIRPMPKAVPIWEKIVACANRVRGRSVRGLSPEEVRSLQTLLEKVHNNLGDAASAASPKGSGRGRNGEVPATTGSEAGRRTRRPRARREEVAK
jgi:MarR family transcriptional regulator for hemolysin